MGPILILLFSAWLLLGATGCSTWRAAEPPEHRLLEEGAEMGHVLVSLQSGDQLELWSARVESDSLVGYTFDIEKGKKRNARYGLSAGPEPAQGSHAAVALGDVKRIEVWRVSASETLLQTGVMAGRIAVGTAVAITIALNNTRTPLPIPKSY
jgi:hypothetical protein